MRLSVLLAFPLVPGLTAAQQRSLPSLPPLHVQVGSAHHRVLVTGGPYRVPVSQDMSGMMMDMAATPVQKFAFPVDGWLQGFRVDLFDGGGHVLPHRLLHHLIMVNFSRRQFLYPALERLLGAAEESDTGDLRIPRTIGVPMKAGQDLGVYATWHNDSGPEIPAAYWRIVLYMAPPSHRRLAVLPAYMDVNIQTNPEENRFNVPPGHFEIGYEFSPPLSGHRYRVVGVFDNPTRDTSYGAMAHMVGLFAPDHYREWPAVDPADPYYQRDLVDLVANGETDSVIVGGGVPTPELRNVKRGRRDSNP